MLVVILRKHTGRCRKSTCSPRKSALEYVCSPEVPGKDERILMRGRIKAVLWGSRKRRVATAILALLLVGGTAYAAWSVITASGTSSGKIGQLAAPTIANGETASAGDLVPNSTVLTGSLRMVITNPNAGQLFLKSFTVDRSTVVGAGDAGCDFNTAPAGKLHDPVTPANSTLLVVAGNPGASTAFKNSLSIAIPGGGVPTQIQVPAVLGLADAVPTGCQGKVLTGITVSNATFSTAP